MNLHLLKEETATELQRILRYWMRYSIDEVHGGFYGKIDNYNKCDAAAAKGSVLNARILWTFSAACRHYDDNVAYRAIADRAFQYITDHFVDNKYGGVYWSVDAGGKPLETKKQIYALAFTIYGCSEYYRCSGVSAAKSLAIHLYELIQQYSYDPVNGGYFEAFARDWQPLTDLRLSNKDANEKKTMNTHLHILEAYTGLYRIWPEPELAKHISLLLYNFDEQIIDRHTGHLHLFFDENWQKKPGPVSYGHDIEAGWLLQEAAEVLDCEELVAKMRRQAVVLANAATEGLDNDGGLWYEYVPEQQQLVKQKHWWPQAEAMVGFLNAWQLSGDDKHLQYVFSNWNFIKQHIVDKKNGEWFWGVDQHHKVMPGEDKAGFWKCSYHNSRACMEVIRRVKM